MLSGLKSKMSSVQMGKQAAVYDFFFPLVNVKKTFMSWSPTILQLSYSLLALSFVWFRILVTRKWAMKHWEHSSKMILFEQGYLAPPNPYIKNQLSSVFRVLAFMELIGDDCSLMTHHYSFFPSFSPPSFFLRIPYTKIDFIPLIASFFFHFCRGRQL